LSGRWKTIAFAIASVVIGLTVLEGIAGLYFFIEDRYWPRILDPGPFLDAEDKDEFMKTMIAHEPTGPGGAIIMQEDDETGWGLTRREPPGLLGQPVNALGLRGAEVLPKTDGELRLLFLGDSTVYGFGVLDDQTMSTSAARGLNKRLGKTTTGVNGGIPGYDSGQSLTLLKRLLDPVQPDWVVIASLWSDCYVDREPWLDGDGVKSSLLARTNTYRLMRRALQPLLRTRKVGWFASQEEMLQARVEDARNCPEKFHSNLVAMAHLAQAGGARPLFLILPAPVDLTWRGAPLVVAEYRKVIRRAAEEAGAPLVDGPELLASKGLNLYHFLDQVHPGPELQQLLGTAVSRRIAEQMEEGRTIAVRGSY
jgi:lysophospholipase L1-like esterase